jgi:hypothetical protein
MAAGGRHVVLVTARDDAVNVANQMSADRAAYTLPPWRAARGPPCCQSALPLFCCPYKGSPYHRERGGEE